MTHRIVAATLIFNSPFTVQYFPNLRYPVRVDNLPGTRKVNNSVRLLDSSYLGIMGAVPNNLGSPHYCVSMLSLPSNSECHLSPMHSYLLYNRPVPCHRYLQSWHEPGFLRPSPTKTTWAAAPSFISQSDWYQCVGCPQTLWALSIRPCEFQRFKPPLFADSLK